MSKGKRYDSEPKLNLKKVFGVVIAFAVLIMIIISIAKILKSNKDKTIITSTTYFPVYLNNKWGVIDDNGILVIDANYDEMVVVPNNKKAVFICIYDINDETGEYKTKAVNEKNEEILKGYEKIEAIDNYDSKQNIWFENSVLKVQKNGKFGLIDLTGKQLLNCEYDNIYALKSLNDSFVVEKDGKIGLVNSKGQLTIDLKYSTIEILKEGYKDAYLVKDENGLYGIVGISGSQILENKYEEIKFLSSADTYAVKENGVWKLVNTKEEVLQESDGEEYIFAKGENVIVKKDNKYGIESLAGETVIPYDYDELSYAFSIYYVAKKDEKYGIINVNNEAVKEFEYESMYVVEEGNFIVADKTDTETVVLDNNLTIKISGIISEVNTQKGYIKTYTEGKYKYYNFKFEEKESKDLLTQNTLYLSKKNDKYGFVDKAGNVVVDYIYDDATEQNAYGYAGIKKDGLWGSIKKNGAVAQDTTVNLDNSIYVDFIDAWHLSDDGLYYTK